MFGDLPSLFGRDFAIGFYIPVASGFALGFMLVYYLDADGSVVAFLSDEPVVGLSISAVLIWLLGVMLLAVNRILYRILEGYGELNPLRLFKWFGKHQRAKYANLKRQIDALVSEYNELLKHVEQGGASDDNHQTNNDTYTNRLNEISITLLKKQYSIATDYPDDEVYVLPTKFGNRIRAFEVYSRVVYGLDSIGGWERIMAFLAAENRETVAASKTTVDFWVNLIVINAILLFVCLAYALVLADAWLVAFAIVFGLLTWGALMLATSVIPQWGEAVKSIFDVHRAALAEHLGFAIPQTAGAERVFWIEQTKVFQLRSSKALDRIDDYRLVAPDE